VGAELFHVERRTGRHDEANSRFSQTLPTRLKSPQLETGYVFRNYFIIHLFSRDTHKTTTSTRRTIYNLQFTTILTRQLKIHVQRVTHQVRKQNILQTTYSAFLLGVLPFVHVVS
jgi:hypothetical protein